MLRSMVQLMVERLPAAVVALGPHDEIVLHNGAARRLLGLTRDAAGAAFTSDPLTAATLASLAGRVRSSGTDLHGEVVHLDGDGCRPLRADALLAPGPRGTGVVLLLHQEDFGLGTSSEVLGDVTHDLRTPLTSIQSTVQLVLRGEAGPLNGDQLRFLSLGCNAAERMGRMLDGLSDLCRQHHGSLSFARGRFPLGELIVPLLEQMRVPAERSQRRLSWDVDPQAWGYVNPDRWLEIVENLVSNALKYTARGGRVRVQLRGERRMGNIGLERAGDLLQTQVVGATLMVLDDGPGMDEATRQRAFQRHYRGDRAQVRSGAGLGLSIAQALTRAHDGRIEIRSEPGRGTLVGVWTPGNEHVARLVALGARIDLALRARRSSNRGHRLRGAVLVACPPPQAAPHALKQFEAGLRAMLPAARWMGTMGSDLGVAVAPPARTGALPSQAGTGRSAAPLADLLGGDGEALGLGCALAPDEGDEAGTLLALALRRARAPVAVLVGDQGRA